jgi:ubiquinone/menaquinone biosynthesis C-methylase UbiE
MRFDYRRDTRSHYQNNQVAEQYHRAFAAPSGWRGIRFRVVAGAERRAVEAMIRRVRHKSILDIPTGTGKLAVVFARLGALVTACDVSPNMLEIAKSEFANAGSADAVFRVQDAANLSEFGLKRFDVVVCLRLMHRVPGDVRSTMFAEFARVADHAVISFGIETGFHRARRWVRSLVAGGGRSSLCYCSEQQARREMAQHFDIIASEWIAPLVSQEMVFLARSKVCSSSMPIPG